jgi:polyisoprenoid-binding protein YceI
VTYYFGSSDARSNVTFESKTEITNILGSTHKATGSVTVDFEAGKGHCHIVVPTLTLNTGMDDRDRAMLGKTWLDAKKNPTIEFKSESAEFTPPSTWKVGGKFTFHGVTQDMTISADVRRIPDQLAKKVNLGEGSWVRVKTSFKIALADYGIKIPPNAVATVEPIWNVGISLDATTVKPPDLNLAPPGDAIQVHHVEQVSAAGIEGTKYEFGKKPQLSTLAARSETEIETVTASTNIMRGILGYDAQKGTGHVRLKVPVQFLKTGIDQRDEHLRSPMWLDAAKYPDILFESTQAKKKDAKTWAVEGNFTLHGQTRPLTIEVTMREISKELIEKAHWGEVPGLGFNAQFKIKLSDFGVGIPDVAKGKVNDEWALNIELVALLME